MCNTEFVEVMDMRQAEDDRHQEDYHGVGCSTRRRGTDADWTRTSSLIGPCENKFRRRGVL